MRHPPETNFGIPKVDKLWLLKNKINTGGTLGRKQSKKNYTKILRDMKGIEIIEDW